MAYFTTLQIANISLDWLSGDGMFSSINAGNKELRRCCYGKILFSNYFFTAAVSSMKAQVSNIETQRLLCLNCKTGTVILFTQSWRGHSRSLYIKWECQSLQEFIRIITMVQTVQDRCHGDVKLDLPHKKWNMKEGEGVCNKDDKSSQRNHTLKYKIKSFCLLVSGVQGIFTAMLHHRRDR